MTTSRCTYDKTCPHCGYTPYRPDPMGPALLVRFTQSEALWWWRHLQSLLEQARRQQYPPDLGLYRSRLEDLIVALEDEMESHGMRKEGEE